MKEEVREEERQTYRDRQTDSLGLLKRMRSTGINRKSKFQFCPENGR